MVVLNGPQGMGKSSFLAKLGGKWFSDSLTIGDMKDKAAPEKLQGYWILAVSYTHLDVYKRQLYDIRNVRMTIVQTRLNNISTYETTTDELIRGAEKEVRPKALLAYEGKGEFGAGEWCRFGRARYTCRKRSEYHIRLAERDFKAPDLLTDCLLYTSRPLPSGE